MAKQGNMSSFVLLFVSTGRIWHHSTADDVPSRQTHQIALAKLSSIQCPVIQVSSTLLPLYLSLSVSRLSRSY